MSCMNRIIGVGERGMLLRHSSRREPFGKFRC